MKIDSRFFVCSGWVVTRRGSFILAAPLNGVEEFFRIARTVKSSITGISGSERKAIQHPRCPET
jgi:hypothetical protein